MLTAGPTADEYRTLALAIQQEVAPELAACLPSNVTVNSVRTGQPANWPIDLFIQFSGEAVSFPSSQHLPPQVASLIRLDWADPSARHPGKVFLPFVPVMVDAGEIEDYYAALADFATKLLSISFTEGMTTTTFQGRIWHRSTFSTSAITGFEVDDHYWTQRDRAFNRPPFDIVQYPMVP